MGRITRTESEMVLFFFCVFSPAEHSTNAVLSATSVLEDRNEAHGKE
jgi:hypothetical protein